MRVTATDFEIYSHELAYCVEAQSFETCLEDAADHTDALYKRPVLSLPNGLEDVGIVDGSAEAGSVNVFHHMLRPVSYYSLCGLFH
jgi:hypothetical protein